MKKYFQSLNTNETPEYQQRMRASLMPEITSPPPRLPSLPALTALEATDPDQYRKDFLAALAKENTQKQILIESVSTNKKMQQIQDEHNRSYTIQGIRNRLVLRYPVPLTLGPAQRLDIDWSLLPGELAEHVAFLSRTTGWDQFPLLMAELGAIMMALRGRYVVRLDPKWDELGVLYLFILGASSDKKGLIVAPLKKPFLDFRLALQEAQRRKLSAVPKNLDKYIAKLERQRVNAILKEADWSEMGQGLGDVFHSINETLRDFQAAAGEYRNDASEVPEIFADRATYLGLAKMLSSQGGGLAVFEPEATSFANMLCDSRADLDIFTKAFCGESFSYDTARNGRVEISRPTLNLCYVVQPELAAQLYKSQRLAGVGVTPRFLPYFNEGTKFVDIAPAEKTHPSEDWYAKKIRSLLEHAFTQSVSAPPFICTPTEEAYWEAKRFEKEMNDLSLAPQCSHMAKFLGKLHGAAVRLALAIHASRHDHPEEHQITLNDVRAGIQIARAITPHADYAFSPSGVRAHGTAKHILEWMGESGYVDFTLREACRDNSLDKSEVLPALQLLAKHNYIDMYTTPRDSRHCIVNPNLRYRNATGKVQ